jgi:hypothetical protein
MSVPSRESSADRPEFLFLKLCVQLLCQQKIEIPSFTATTLSQHHKPKWQDLGLEARKY